METLEEVKQAMIENMAYSIETIKAEHPIFGTQDEYDAWYREEFEVGRKWIPDSEFMVLMWVKDGMQKMMIEKATAEPRRVVKRIVQKQTHMLNPRKKQGGVSEEEIEQAREYPIEDMIDTKIFKATGKWRANAHCPLSEHAGEKTSSFYIDKNNRYKCFGCHGSGDAIEFVMDRDGVGFVRAVKSLIR